MVLTDIEIDHEEVQVPTAISYQPPPQQQHHAIFADSRTELDHPDHNLKSTSLIMRTLRSANQFDEVMRELGCASTATATTTVKETPFPPWTVNGVQIPNDLSRSSQLITNMNAITKSNSGNNWWRVESSPSPVRRYSSSVDGDSLAMPKEERFESNRQRRFSHESATSSFLSKLSPASSTASSTAMGDNMTNLKHVTHLNTLLEETKRLSDRVDGQLGSKLMMHTGDAKKPIAAPRIKKIGSSSVMSQLTQLRRMYEAAEEDSDTSTKADEEVRSYLGDKSELFSGSWSKIKAKRNSAILSDIRNDHDLHLGIAKMRIPHTVV